MASIYDWMLTMTTTYDKTLYDEMGKRIAICRKERGLTKVQLAAMLSISQQTLAHYEVGRLRIAVSTLPQLAETLYVNIEEFINDSKKQGNNKRGPTPKLQYQIEQIGLMQRSKQKFITEMLDALIQQQQVS